MQISCSTSYIFSIGYSLFQKVSRTSYVSQETFLGSKNLFWRKKKINGIFFFFFFFVSLVRMIVNIIGASSCKPRGFRAFIYPFCSIDNQTKYKLLKLYTRQKAPCYYTSLFSRLFTTRMDFEVPIVFRNFWKSHCCCCQETSKKTFYSKCYMKVIPIFWLY